MIAIKAIIFFAFWQAVVFSFLVSLGFLPDIYGWTKEELSNGLNNFVISVEMLVLALCHYWVFTHKPYKRDEDDASILLKTKKIGRRHLKVLDQRDLFRDMRHVYNVTRDRKAKKKHIEMHPTEGQVTYL